VQFFLLAAGHWGGISNDPNKYIDSGAVAIAPGAENHCDVKTRFGAGDRPDRERKINNPRALIDYINETRDAHIITIEDPLEFIHPNKKCLFTHREIGTHAKSFSDALMVASREDPDIILVGEMRDTTTISLALTCAELGILVFGTLHTNSASKTVDRIINAFPADQQEQTRTMLAESLSAVVAQQLLKTRDGKGRCAAQ